jgi:MacB-like periplasmic core domain
MWIENLRQDVHFAVRLARRNLGFTALAALTLSIGIGGATAVFSVFKTVLVNQLPYGNPDRLVALSEIDAAGRIRDGVGGWTANEWRRRASFFEHISLYGDGQRVLIASGQSEVLRGLRVNYDFFETLGVKMLLGRAFLPEDDRWPRNNVVVLSYGLWISRFGGDPNIIQRALNFSAESYRVIGVLPRDFYPLRMSNPVEKPAIYMPLGYDPREGSTCRYQASGSDEGLRHP